MDHVIGCKTSHEAWIVLQERYGSVSGVRINQLKTEFHTSQKGGETVDKFLLRLKGIREQFMSVGEKITDNDYIIAVLTGLPTEFEMIKTVILARETPISMKDFRAQLLSAEGTIDSRIQSVTSCMSAMYVNGANSDNQRFQGGFEQGESSNAQRFQEDQFSNGFQGGSGFMGHGNRGLHPQQRDNNYSNRKFAGGNNYSSGSNNSQFYSGGNNVGNRSGGNGGNFSGNNNYSTRGNSYSTGGNSSGGNNRNSFSSNGSNIGKWNGNPSFKVGVSPECQICSRRGHTAPNCYYRSENGNSQSSGITMCQICGKRGHIALECYRRNNYAYQWSPPPPYLAAMTAQTQIDKNEGQGNKGDHVPRQE
ncbi:uncharacterized protein LOC126597757 [Malus sylvestris]|uniref:uncharacterized protein LOC126597757 n=1 Tax=Malus sylvestris TaxID=3752 RepID=UPI0021AD4568|nr:uncharacterized protein LOC126597757 [Malus sylvestris]